ncbi:MULTISPECIES: hypothetical protein [Vibrio]|uniref:hypothetical protein n=1 Tax=Vibrio TaxID=662 RepID=UPI000FB00F3E|nr:hypothetical protein [Vibrio crassostreae]ROS70674.1 hypothetical protein EDB73_101350 [Vibrio crassostreae]TCN99127.1 hypothetical protein EDB50_101910 [Vibrio crassostreae]CAK3387991.1 hypothetical protein VCRA2127O344_30272 [Vibrio crassostreae]
MKDILDGLKELILFTLAIVLLFLGWAFSGGFTPLDILVPLAIMIHYIWAFKFKNKNQ